MGIYSDHISANTHLNIHAKHGAIIGTIAEPVQNCPDLQQELTS